MQNSPIFIGGTGRSGTTILSRYLGSHHLVANVPFESRFLIDKDGLLDLYTSLHENYSINQGRIALRRFEELVKQGLADPYSTPYLGYNRYGTFSRELLHSATDRLLRQLSVGTFEGRDYSTLGGRANVRRYGRPVQTLINRITKPVLGKPLSVINYSYQGIEPAEQIYVPRYFREGRALAQVLAGFVDELFGTLLTGEQRRWCEDTPANVCHLPFLRALYPEAKFINIVRHPVGVAHSMARMPWAPHDYGGVADYLEQLFERMITAHEEAEREFGDSYRMIRLEDLVDRTKITELMEWLELDPMAFDGSIKIEENKINHYRKTLASADRSLLESRLTRPIEYFGYTE